MNEINWSKSEKVVARRAFDTAYKRECDAITAKLKEMIAKATEPKHIWRIHDYLTRQRKNIDEKYVYRYSILTLIFARLLSEGWLKMSDLEGLGEDKIEEIKKLTSKSVG
jgi:hypothetical protein